MTQIYLSAQKVSHMHGCSLLIQIIADIRICYTSNTNLQVSLQLPLETKLSSHLVGHLPHASVQ